MTDNDSVASGRERKPKCKTTEQAGVLRVTDFENEKLSFSAMVGCFGRIYAKTGRLPTNRYTAKEWVHGLLKIAAHSFEKRLEPLDRCYKIRFLDINTKMKEQEQESESSVLDSVLKMIHAILQGIHRKEGERPDLKKRRSLDFIRWSLFPKEFDQNMTPQAFNKATHLGGLSSGLILKFYAYSKQFQEATVDLDKESAVLELERRLPNIFRWYNDYKRQLSPEEQVAFQMFDNYGIFLETMEKMFYAEECYVEPLSPQKQDNVGRRSLMDVPIATFVRPEDPMAIMKEQSTACQHHLQVSHVDLKKSQDHVKKLQEKLAKAQAREDEIRKEFESRKSALLHAENSQGIAKTRHMHQQAHHIQPNYLLFLDDMWKVWKSVRIPNEAQPSLTWSDYCKLVGNVDYLKFTDSEGTALAFGSNQFEDLIVNKSADDLMRREKQKRALELTPPSQVVSSARRFDILQKGPKRKASRVPENPIAPDGKRIRGGDKSFYRAATKAKAVTVNSLTFDHYKSVPDETNLTVNQEGATEGYRITFHTNVDDNQTDTVLSSSGNFSSPVAGQHTESNNFPAYDCDNQGGGIIHHDARDQSVVSNLNEDLVAEPVLYEHNGVNQVTSEKEDAPVESPLSEVGLSESACDEENEHESTSDEDNEHESTSNDSRDQTFSPPRQAV